MSQVTLETILAQVSQLPLSEQEQLRALLTDKLRTKEADDHGTTAEGKSLDEPVVQATIEATIEAAIKYRDRSLENQWLEQHGREYIDQWVLLEGERLITHSSDALEVFAAAQAAGIEIPYIVHVEDPDQPVLMGW